MNDKYLCVATYNTLGYTFTHFDKFAISTVFQPHQLQMLRASCLTLETKGFRYYEDRIEESK